MEFSLEDDECMELFITQTPSENLVSHVQFMQDDSNFGIFKAKGEDFVRPCGSLVNAVHADKPIYEDISDDDTAFEGITDKANFE